ncbi:MAG: 16S rRNA (cytidine(1402)-2'-O)-methyltransferase [Pseudomonadota bacterium]|nr:16S rRNA (cytidine(1402)-2'-O)-methyltransferase [Pseudomonadota bacterium]
MANKTAGDISALKKAVAHPKIDTSKIVDFAALVDRLRKNYTTPPETGLYLVPTPIGNAEDITLRALKILDSVDIIACEDTRHTGSLLSRYGIATRRLAYHDYSGAKARRKLLDLLAEGKSIALVSDAGTPLISDPGYKLVLEALEENITVVPLPGPSAPTTALVFSGLPPDKYFFAGFLPTGGANRQRALKELSTLTVTILLLESPRKLGPTLGDLHTALGDRKAALARELTKLHEQIERAGLAHLAEKYQGTSVSLKGELVIAIGPPSAPQLEYLRTTQLEEASGPLEEALKHMNTKGAVQYIAEATGLSKRLLYKRALQLKQIKE